jgi:enoyl-CoA hydratase
LDLLGFSKLYFKSSDEIKIMTDIQSEIEENALIITLNRVDHANSYTQTMLSSIEELVNKANQNENIRSIVITGSGNKVFCAGADRNEIDSRDWRSILDLKSAAVFKALRESPKVVIAAINGAAVGGGFELALSCDIRIATPNAKFWLPELEFGLLPAAAAVNLLPKYIGLLKAKDIIVGGAHLTSGDALIAGLVSEVCKEGDLNNCVSQWRKRIDKRSSEAIKLVKRSLEMSASGVDTSQIDLITQALLATTRKTR